MREKIHTIIDLCMALENGVTHSLINLITSNGFLSVTVWEGKELNTGTEIYSVMTWVDDELGKEEELDDIIQALEELKNGI